MKNIIFISISLLFSLSGFAQEYCSRNQSDILAALNNPSQRIAFKNAGGLFDGGVCWWHARLQRSAVYLAKFEPSRPKPSAALVNSILMGLRSMEKTVVIPGYSDFYTFTKENQAATQKMLDGWQTYDGVFNQEWRRGISGRTSLPADELEKQMQAVFTAYKDSPVPVWVMAQMKGITSHSFLIVDMVQQGSGFDLKVIDSNAPGKTRQIAYKYGQTSLVLVGTTTPFILYVGFQNDFRLISAAIKASCRTKTPFLDDFSHIQDGVIELPHRKD